MMIQFFIFSKLTTFEEVSSIDKEVQRVLLWKLDTLSNDVVEMIGGQIIWDKVPKDK